MFIIAWIATLIINANDWFVIPGVVETIIMVLAALEALLYLIVGGFQLYTLNKIRKDF